MPHPTLQFCVIYIFPVLLMWHYEYLLDQWRKTWLLKSSIDSIIDDYKAKLIKVHRVTSMQLQFKNNVEKMAWLWLQDWDFSPLSTVKKVEFEEFLLDIYIYLTRLYRGIQRSYVVDMGYFSSVIYIYFVNWIMSGIWKELKVDVILFSSPYSRLFQHVLFFS